MHSGERGCNARREERRAVGAGGAGAATKRQAPQKDRAPKALPGLVRPAHRTCVCDTLGRGRPCTSEERQAAEAGGLAARNATRLRDTVRQQGCPVLRPARELRPNATHPDALGRTRVLSPSVSAMRPSPPCMSPLFFFPLFFSLT